MVSLISKVVWLLLLLKMFFFASCLKPLLWPIIEYAAISKARQVDALFYSQVTRHLVPVAHAGNMQACGIIIIVADVTLISAYGWPEFMVMVAFVLLLLTACLFPLDATARTLRTTPQRPNVIFACPCHAHPMDRCGLIFACLSRYVVSAVAVDLASFRSSSIRVVVVASASLSLTMYDRPVMNFQFACSKSIEFSS